MVNSDLAAFGTALRKLREVGVAVSPNAGLSFYNRPCGPTSMVVVDRVKDTPDPAYCVHGFTECINCNEMVLLGDQTLAAIEGGGVVPICRWCATELINLHERKPVGRITDTLRGLPHDGGR